MLIKGLFGRAPVVPASAVLVALSENLAVLAVIVVVREIFWQNNFFCSFSGSFREERGK